MSLELLLGEYTKGNTTLEGYDVPKEVFLELLQKYINDKNSSTLREEIMCRIANLTPNGDKLGFDSLDTNDEMKPKNYDTNNPRAKKLSGSGNFSDMTLARHQRFMGLNPTIHIGGFVDGKIIFQIKVPYNGLASHFQKQLDKHFPTGDRPNNYLRSMNYSLPSLKECSEVQVEFLSSEIDQYRTFMTNPLYIYLKSLTKDE